MKRFIGVISFVLLLTGYTNAQETIFMAAERGNLAQVKNLLDAGISVDAQDKDGNTALYAAAYNGHTDIVKELLAQYADPNIANDAGETPLFAAIENNLTDIVDLLIKAGANTNTQTKDGVTLLMLAAQKGNAELTKGILSADDENGNNAAFYASTAKALAALKKQGANLSKKNKQGQTPLFAAVANNNLEAVKYLVRHTSDINKGDNNGFTPLMQAVYDKNTEMVEYLLKAKAKPNAKTALGHTALDYTFFLSDFFEYNKKISDIYAAHDNFSFVTDSHIALQLIKAGATSKTRKDDLLLILVSAALDNIVNKNEQQVEDVKYILAMPNAISKDKASLVLVEMLNRSSNGLMLNNLSLFKALLNASDPEILLKSGSFRQLFGSDYVVFFLEAIQESSHKEALLRNKKLLSAALLPIIANKPIILSEKEVAKNVQFLIDNGADPNYNNMSLVSMAEEGNLAEVAQILEKAGGKRSLSGDSNHSKEIAAPMLNRAGYEQQEQRRQRLLHDLYGSIAENKNARVRPAEMWLADPAFPNTKEEKEAEAVLVEEDWSKPIDIFIDMPEPEIVLPEEENTPEVSLTEVTADSKEGNSSQAPANTVKEEGIKPQETAFSKTEPAPQQNNTAAKNAPLPNQQTTPDLEGLKVDEESLLYF